MHHLNDDDLVLHYYGEPEAVGAAAHLESCGECRQRFSRLQRVMSAVDDHPDPAPSPGFERTIWARLEPSLPRQRRWTSRILLTSPKLAWAATVVLLITAAFFAGRITQPTSGGPEATTEQIREGVLLTDLTEHLHRSQTMLVELVSADAAPGDDMVDISLERDVAQDLVAANRLYRQTLGGTGDAALTELLEDLERLLVEVAASPQELSAEDMERVRQRVTARDLLFKVRVVSGAIQDRQRERIRARADQSS